MPDMKVSPFFLHVGGSQCYVRVYSISIFAYQSLLNAQMVGSCISLTLLTQWQGENLLSAFYIL